jgi:hypothetical protein
MASKHDAITAAHVLEKTMPILLQVWHGTENAADVLEDACNTIGHAYGLDSEELRALWHRVKRKRRS